MPTNRPDASRHLATLITDTLTATTPYLDRRGRAARALHHAVVRCEPMIIDGRLANWYAAFFEGVETAMTVDVSEHTRAVTLQRAVLILDGTLIGPSADIAGLNILVGERVAATRVRPPAGSVTGAVWPPIGVLGCVIDVDLEGRWIDIDFPVHGSCRLQAEPVAASPLRYSYVAVTTRRRRRSAA